jgi:hypothetical protein
MTTGNGERNLRGMASMMGALVAAVLAAYLVFLWLN